MGEGIKILLFLFLGLPLMIVIGVLWYHAIDLLFICCETVKGKILKKNTEVVKMKEKTGYYDRNGKEIRDGDRLKAIFKEEDEKYYGLTVCGEVARVANHWLLFTYEPYKPISADLWKLDDIEILEEE